MLKYSPKDKWKTVSYLFISGMFPHVHSDQVLMLEYKNLSNNHPLGMTGLRADKQAKDRVSCPAKGSFG